MKAPVMESIVERRLLINYRIAFPTDSIALDSALVMRNVPATWHRAPSIDLTQLSSAGSTAA